ncbi:MAG: hypothetical protein QM770_15770 [Tepidisphaeraceae bacterium]
MNDLTKDEREALKAFKKKIKATQLDEDSKLGRSPLSGSGHERIVAIQPPSGFGRTVWETLATKGYLRRDGGFYELVNWKAQG